MRNTENNRILIKDFKNTIGLHCVKIADVPVHSLYKARTDT